MLHEAYLLIFCHLHTHTTHSIYTLTRRRQWKHTRIVATFAQLFVCFVLEVLVITPRYIIMLYYFQNT